MLRGILTFFRLLGTSWVLVRHDALVPGEYAESVPWFVRFFGAFSRVFALRERAGNPGERLARALEKLGPSYIKFGQILSTRGDMLDPVFTEGLSRLKDKVPAFPMAIAEEMLAREWGGPWQEKLETLSGPVAAASVAQVHKATLKSGETVAIKILRPNIRKAVGRDMDVLHMVAGFVEFFVTESRRLGPKAFVGAAERSLQLELDLRLEAAAASELGEAAVDTGHFKVPEIFWDLGGKDILVTEWIDGKAVSDPTILTDPSYDPKAVAVKAMQTFLTCSFDYGVFHADMHEGNMIIEPDGTLVLIDFGILGRLSPKEQRFHAEILYGFTQRDYLRIAGVHFKAGYIPAKHTVEDFASALRAVGEPIFGKTASNVSMSKVLLQLFEITDIFDMQMQPQLILLQKTMMQTEGVCRYLNPDFDMWGTAAPVVEASMRRELGPEGRISDLFDGLDHARRTLEKLPDAVENIAALAQAWADGKVDLSRPAVTSQINGKAVPTRGFAWAGFGAILTLGTVWVISQL
ncbi:MAG: ubiquinone biosynthesis protein UbiB [Hyphomonadaceae bacterium]|nr:ubiquinone biosynthesis protein UbiB [Hyphomonadaceae bacterium]